MHTTKTKNAVFIHNDNFSGEVIIHRVDMPRKEVIIPFTDLLEIVGIYLRDKRICSLESSSGIEYLINNKML